MSGVALNIGSLSRYGGRIHSLTRRLLPAVTGGLILDQLSVSPEAAFSLRRLRTAYTGPCLRVRRSSDNAEQDIGWDGDSIDSVALLAFCGSASGFVVAWYDQSINVRDVSQVTAGNQPRIVNAGVYSNEINFSVSSASGRLLFATALTFAAYPFTTNAVLRKLTTGIGMIWANLASSMQMLRVDGTTAARIVAGSAYGTTFDASVPAVVTQNTTSSSSATGWANGTSVGTGAANSQGLTTNGIGAWGSAGVTNFTLRETMVFAGTLSTTDRQLLERSQGASFGITVA